MLSAPFFKTAKEISGSEPTTVWIASAKRTWYRSFFPFKERECRFGCRRCRRRLGTKTCIPWSAFTEDTLIVSYPFSDPAISAYRDPAGAIWWFCAHAIYRYDAGNYTRIALPPSFPKPFHDRAIAMTEDGSGVLWLAAVREGLFYRKKGGWHRLEIASELAKLFPTTAFTDWMGRAWFGYEGGTIILLNR